MITDRLKELVKIEADGIKIYANDAEINKLDFSELDPSEEKFCIYGQMTGSCYSHRAADIISKITKPFSHLIDNFKPAREVLFDEKLPFRCDFTPIEFYIFQKDAKNENIINYIKGKSEILEL